MGKLIRSDSIAAAIATLADGVVAASSSSAPEGATPPVPDTSAPDGATSPGAATAGAATVGAGAGERREGGPVAAPHQPRTVVIRSGGGAASGTPAGTSATRADAQPGSAPDPDEVFDVVIIGAGPAGLSAGLNLVRARRRVLMLDSNRPRHSATLMSHGFLTRDGVSPLDLRRLGRQEFEAYAEASFHQGMVSSIERVAEGEGELFVVKARGIRGSGDRTATARTVLIATGLMETLPALPSMRAYYGTSLHSCTECDGYEKSDAPLALIGETPDLAERALLLSQWTNDLIVFTNGVAELTEAEETALDARGIGVERRPIADIEGDRTGMTGVSLVDGTVILRSGGFVRPIWSTALDYSGMLGLTMNDDHLIEVDSLGRTSTTGVFAAGDSTPPGAEQLIVAAGEGAKVAAAINRHLIGIL